MSVEDLFIILFGILGLVNIAMSATSATQRGQKLGSGLLCIGAALWVAYTTARI